MRNLSKTQVETRSTPQSLWVDVVLAVVVISVFIGLVQFAREWAAPSQAASGGRAPIDLSLAILPVYALTSLARGLFAYLLSLLFSLFVGGLAARNKTAEKIIIPMLDVLQGIPVLGFMPGIILAMISIFPGNNVGLELGCVLMIFTAQTWNLAFAFYGSIKSLPKDLLEVGTIHQYSRWQIFRRIELPASAIPMVWNSMMSMAGGWFFLTVCEAFTLGHRDYRLPGIGSYMALAIEQGNNKATAAAVFAMCLIIFLSDRLLWNPLSVWSMKYRLDEAGPTPPKSWVLQFLRRSIALRKLRALVRAEDPRNHLKLILLNAAQRPGLTVPDLSALLTVWPPIRRFLIAGISLIVLVPTLRLLQSVALMCWGLSSSDWLTIARALGLTFLRTLVCLTISVVWALPLGILIGKNQKLSTRAQPLVQLLAAFPAPMIYPFVISMIIWTGLDFDYGCTLLMALGAQWYILFNVIAGAQLIPDDLKDVGQVFRMSRLGRWIRIYIPAVIPSLVTGVVTAAGGAWNASIVSEYVRYGNRLLVADGLGSTITRSAEAGDMDVLCASVLTMALALVLINRLAWKPLFSLADQKYTMNR